MVVERDWVQDFRSPGTQEARALGGRPRCNATDSPNSRRTAARTWPGVRFQWRIHMSDIATPPALRARFNRPRSTTNFQPARKGPPDRLPGPVRLLMIQHERDLAAGLNTAGFVSGYRVRRSAGWTRPCGRLARILPPTISSSSRASTRILRLPRCGARNRSISRPRPATTASMRCGTARVRGRSQRGRVPPRQCGGLLQAWWGASWSDRRRRPCRKVLHAAAPDGPLLQVDDDAGAGAGRSPGVPLTSASMAGRCLAIPVAGSPSRRSPIRSRPRPRSMSIRSGSRS